MPRRIKELGSPFRSISFHYRPKEIRLPSTTPLRNSSVLSLDESEVIASLFFDPTRSLSFEFLRIRTRPDNAFIWYPLENENGSSTELRDSKIRIMRSFTRNHVFPVFAIYVVRSRGLPASFPRSRARETEPAVWFRSFAPVPKKRTPTFTL